MRLARVLSWLRWPFAACAIASLVMMVVTYWYSPSVFVVLFGMRTGVTIDSSLGIVRFDTKNPNPTHVDAYWQPISDDYGPPGLEYRFHLSFDPLSPSGGQSYELFFPVWAVVLPLGALASLGFVAQRRWIPRPGECARCRHLLAGASACPECGLSATAVR